MVCGTLGREEAGSPSKARTISGSPSSGASISGASGGSREDAFAARVAAASSSPLLGLVASSRAAFLAFASSFSLSTSSANLLRHSSV